MGMSAADYCAELQALLPVGAAWPRDQQEELTKLLDALAQELGRLDVRSEQLMDEVDPRTTSELLADWERIAGLPDSCVSASQSMQERRAALLSRLTNIGGQSKAFFITLADTFGYDITVTEFAPFRANENAAGDSIYGDDWVFAWRANAPSLSVREFAANESAAGDPLRSWGNQLLECILNRLKPAHSVVLFAYSGDMRGVATGRATVTATLS